MYKYLTVKEKLFHEDIGAYISYGIICIDKETKREISKVSDVSTRKAFVKALAKKFTRLTLSPDNLLSAIELEI